MTNWVLLIKVIFRCTYCLVDALVPGLAVKGADAAHLPVVEGYLLKAKRERVRADKSIGDLRSLDGLWRGMHGQQRPQRPGGQRRLAAQSQAHWGH